MFLKRLLTKKADPSAPAEQQDLAAAALTSPDVRVRRDACRHLKDLTTLRRLAAEDEDAAVRDLAGARYRRLLCGLDEGAPPLAARLAELGDASDQQMIGDLASQAREPELRLAAIGRLTRPEALATCAIDDPLAANRLAAAERVRDKIALERIAKGIGKRDKRVYRLVRERLKAIAEAEERPRLAREQGNALCDKLERLGRFDNWTQDRAVLEHLERQWQAISAEADEPLRTRYGNLRQRFLDAYDAYARDHAAQLAAKQARADAATARQGLIAELEQAAALDDLAALDARLEENARAWASSDAPEPSAATRLDKAHAAALAAAKAQRERLQQRRRHAQTADRLMADTRKALSHGGAPERKTLRSLQRRFDELADDVAQRDAIREALDQLTHRFDKHRRQLERRLAQLPERLAELDAHFEQGELKKAEPLYQSISATLDHARAAGLPQSDIAPVDAHLKDIAPRLHELRQWRRWSADEHRTVLCEAMDVLAGDEEHGLEQAANRLHELQREWRNLDRNGAPAADALWQRFHQAAERVHERCKPFLDQQAALRAENRKQREALCKRLEEFMDQVDWERIDWKKLVRAEREMRQAWSDLGPVEGRHHKPLEGRFRRDLRRLDKVLSEERERNQAEKRALIGQMEALADEPDLRRAIDGAKALQQQWHTTVAGRQRDENALWKAFRAASDAVFARREAEIKAKGAELRENESAREAICQELAALSASDAMDPARFEQALRGLKTRWHDTESMPLPRAAGPALSKQWRAALAEANVRLEALRESARWAATERLASRADWLDQTARALAGDAEPPSAEGLKAGWSALPELEDADSAAALEERFGEVLAALDDPAERAALARRLDDNRGRRGDLCLHLEIVAGVPSPEPLREQRMALQVERLRERMGEGEADPLADAGPLLRDWYLSTPAAADADLEARFARVREGLERR